MRVRLVCRWTSVICNYFLACVAIVHTPVSGATAILNPTGGNEGCLYGLNALLTYM